MAAADKADDTKGSVRCKQKAPSDMVSTKIRGKLITKEVSYKKKLA